MCTGQAPSTQRGKRALWHSILTTGAVMLGVHMVTVPLAWPRQDTAFQGLCRSTSQGPNRVRCCATMRPVLVSCTALPTHVALLTPVWILLHDLSMDAACIGEAALCSSANWEQHRAAGRSRGRCRCQQVHGFPHACALRVNTCALIHGRDFAQLQAHLVPQHARLADRGEQEVVGQKIQAPRRHMLLHTHAQSSLYCSAYHRLTYQPAYRGRQLDAIMPAACCQCQVVPQAGGEVQPRPLTQKCIGSKPQCCLTGRTCPV